MQNLIFFLCSRIPFRIPHCIQLSGLLRFILCVSFSHFPILRSTGYIFCGIAFHWNVSDAFFNYQTGVIEYWEEETQCYFYYIILSTRSITANVNLDHLAEGVFVRFLYFNITIFPLIILYYISDFLHLEGKLLVI